MADPAADRLAVLFGLRLRGLADTAAVAELTGVPADRCGSQLAQAEREGLVAKRQGRTEGWVLRPPGRAEVAKLLADDLAASGVRAMIEDAYRRFLTINGGFLGLCTDWQMTDRQTLNDHTDPAYDAATIARLGVFDEHVQPICVALDSALPRFAHYGRRLAEARRKVEHGDTDWFTNPRVDSYHTVWFELHEALLATLGIERSQEGR